MGKKPVDTVGPGSPEDEGTKSHAPHGPMRLSLSKRSRYEEFVAANGDGLVKPAYTICADRGRAEDAVQETLIRVYQRWSRLTDPLAYARRTAINATRADWRRRSRVPRGGPSPVARKPTIHRSREGLQCSPSRRLVFGEWRIGAW
jgi:DNA-directed RNA polymerase specialized sigma24 family protein